MSQPPPPSVRAFNAEPQAPPRSSNSSTQNPALRGASLAFQAPPVPAKPLINTYSGTNGALVAATRAGLGQAKAGDNVSIVGRYLLTPTTADIQAEMARGGPLRRTASDDGSVGGPGRGQIPAPLVNTYSGNNGALVAATRAGLAQQGTGEQAASAARYLLTPTTVEKQAEMARGGPLRRAVSDGYGAGESKGGNTMQPSPSQIAATKAAARFTAVPAPPPVIVRGKPPPTTRRLLTSAAMERKDETPIPATNTLVELFESKNRSERGKVDQAMQPTLQPAVKIVSPKPLRPQSASVKTLEPEDPLPPLYLPKTNDITKRHSLTALAAARSASPMKPLLPRPFTSAKLPPALPPPRGRPRSTTIDIPPQPTVDSSTHSDSDSSSNSSYTSAKASLSRTNTLEQAFSTTSPLISSQPKPRLPHRPSTTTTITTTDPPRQPLRPISRATVLRPRLSTSSLANALVASTLATSRAPSPTKPPPQPIPHKRSRRVLFPPHQTINRTPSPSKLLTTLRVPPSPPPRKKDQKDIHHHHGRLVKSHPHKHHEGSRRRWRDVLTERERKRYEGVWAANRGILLRRDEGREEVHGFVVREVWNRSQLSAQVLEQVWDLVTRGVGAGVGTGRGGGGGGNGKSGLGREEFVVGLWLIDQCLKGRKLPGQVGESVWGSVRLVGVRIGA